MGIDYEHIYQHVLPALESKRNEFKHYQYDSVTEEDIWKYLLRKKWRKRDVSEMQLYQMINDIMQTSPAEYMTNTQVEEFKTSNWFSELNQEELQVLLNPQAGKNDREE
jgi:hypothetical protein